MPEGVVDILADVGLCALYIILNAALNFVNRWALGVHGFRFPLTLTAAHMLLNPVFLVPLMLGAFYRRQHAGVLSRNARALLAIAVLNATQIALNNSSLVHIELSMNQVVRASVPVIVGAMQCVNAAVPPRSHLCCLVVISLGVSLVVYDPNAVAAAWTGIVFVVSSVSMQAAQMVFAGNLLSEKLDSFQITFYTSPPAFLTLLVPTASLEGPAFRAFAAVQPRTTAGVLIGTCAIAVLYNVVLFQTIRRLNAVGSAVLGNVKIVILLIMSSVLMGEMKGWTSRQHLGCVLTFASAAAYSALKLFGGDSSKRPAEKKGK